MNPDPGFTKRFQRHGKFVYHPFTVKKRENLTPRYVRITLGGPNIHKLYFLSPDDDVRVAIPLSLNDIPGDLRVEYDPEYRVIYPEDAPPYEVKAYTICRFDTEAEEIDLEVAIHDRGHGAVWARNAEPGQTVLVAGAWGSYIFEGPMDHIVLVGDETALPAIRHWIKHLEAPTSATVVAEVASKAEHLDFDPADGVEVQVHWVHRGDEKPGKNSLLLDAVRTHIELLPNCLYWGAGESSTLRTIRRFMVEELGVNRKAIQMGGYWKREDDKEDWFLHRDQD